MAAEFKGSADQVLQIAQRFSRIHMAFTLNVDPLGKAVITCQHEEVMAAAVEQLGYKLPTDNWGVFDDMSFPLTSPADLREQLPPGVYDTRSLNLWEDATHQITFDGGKHWTNVIREEGNPAYYVACSDGKRAWLVDNFSGKQDRVVPRPENYHMSIHSTNDGLDEMRSYSHTVTGRISDPQPQQIERGRPSKRAGLTHGRTMVGMTDGRVEYRDNERSLGGPINEHPQGKRIPMLFSDPTHQARYERGVCVECGNEEGPCHLCGGRIPASVGDAPACPMTDTCFDSDPSVVGE